MAGLQPIESAIVRRRGPNPYVGPRAFKEEDSLYGRDHELDELVDLLIAERVVVMHSTSGAGKTSLIQAALVPELRDQRFRPLPLARVNLPVQADRKVNRYATSVVLSLESKLTLENNRPGSAPPGTIEELSRISLSDYLRSQAGEDGSGAESKSLVLIIDQFEEIFLLDPADEPGRAIFFHQLGDVLEQQRLWVLLSMREEYLGGLDTFAHEIPTGLGVRYRLDLLTQDAAKNAIQKPPRETHSVTVTDDAADLLVRNLSMIFVQSPGGGPMRREEGRHVEGVILQTVCRRIWEEIDPVAHDLTEIGPEHLGDFTNVDRVLAQYYSDAVGKAARGSKLRERVLRDWFENVLITQQGFRSQTDTGPGINKKAATRCIHLLEKQHLIRSEPRLNRRWYELVHDRFIEPILRDNNAWRARMGFDEIPRRAQAWEANRSRNLLLSGDGLARAMVWLTEHKHDVYSVEREYIDESRRVLDETEEQEQHDSAVLYLYRSRQKWRAMASLLLVATVVCAVLVLVLSM
jgi:hypothetical protein